MTILTRNLEEFLREYEKSWTLSGTILVAEKGDVIIRTAFGYSNLEHHVPNTVETKFRIWSLTKSFTAMAIMMLYEKRLVKFEDKISSFFPEFSKNFEGITIANLLNHTSGLVNYTSIDEYNGKLNKLRLSHQDVINLIIDHPLQFKPGSAFYYNNSGYFLLGLIIERISGLKFDEFLTRSILEPLGMKDTGIDDNRKVIPLMASSYHASGSDFIQCEYMDLSSSFSAGAMYSTIDDLFLWDKALYTENLVSKSTLEMAFNPSFNYGFGWFIDEQFNRKRIHHGGAYRGFRSEMHRYPMERNTVIMLTNYDFVPVVKLTQSLSGILFGETAIVPTLPQKYPLEDDLYATYMGTYEGFGCKAVVDRKGNDLYFIFNDEYIPFYPISKSKFHHTWVDWECEFLFDDYGDISFLGMDKTK